MLLAFFGFLVYLYFKNKKGGAENAGTKGNVVTSEDLQRIHGNDLQRLERIETTISEIKTEFRDELKEIRSAFSSIVRERGDMMAQIGELKGEVKSLLK